MTDTATTSLRRRRDTSRLTPRYRAMLETLWRSHLDEITRLSVRALPPYADEEGEPSPADILVAAHLTASARHQLEEVEAALRRLDNGTYGRCEGCGDMILAERLEILPAARHCVACQRRRAPR